MITVYNMLNVLISYDDFVMLLLLLLTVWIWLCKTLTEPLSVSMTNFLTKAFDNPNRLRKFSKKLTIVPLAPINNPIISISFIP